ncbi:MAG: hypothetical protein AAGF73_10690 [Actinomycetota bacterium]
MRAVDSVVIAAGAAYVAFVGWAMQGLSYDIWGGLVVAPLLALASYPLINAAFRDELVELRKWAWLGLVAKFGGAVVGYFVRFDVFGGSADAQRYHNYAKVTAGAVYDGVRDPFSLVPTGSGTVFTEQFTAVVYLGTGSSRLGGFFIFAWLSFWGLVFFVKAAHWAMRNLEIARYALFVFLFPSLVYWGSSIGKESLVGLGLGVSAYGAAIVLSPYGRRPWGAALCLGGLVWAGLVRPHFAALWAAGLVIAFVGKILFDAVGPDRNGTQRGVQAGTLVLAVVAVVGFVFVFNAALDFLPSPDDGDVSLTDEVNSIFVEVDRRTTTGGSAFNAPGIGSPTDWPYAVYRTMTRPLLFEADSVGELLPALEMTALLIIGVFSWRRFANVPRMMVRYPYVIFAATCVALGGLAFASIGNLGILVRQRSLVLPLLLLFWCLPRRDADAGDDHESNGSAAAPVRYPRVTARR